jgi:4-hydroxy-2-oxoheptanedioate aldolase
MRPNKMKKMWREGKPTFGIWLQACNPFIAETMSCLGFDWVLVDGEHSPVDMQTMVKMLQAISVGDSVPLARAQWNDPVEIKRILDGGAYGVVIPWVNNRDEAQQAVSACRYPPDGIRGWGPLRAALYGGAGYTEGANDEIACIVQIETAEAVDNIDEIVTVRGVDAVMIGPADLALSLGLEVRPDHSHPDHVGACKKVLEACKKHGVVPGIFTSGPEEGARRAQEGWLFMPIGTDMQYVTQAAVRGLKTARADK